MLRKVLVVLYFVGFLAPFAKADLQKGCSLDAYVRATDLVNTVTKQVDLGTLHPVELAKAYILVAEMKYCTGINKVSLEDTCKIIIVNQKQVLETENQKFTLGASTISSVIEEQRRLANFEVACGIK